MAKFALTLEDNADGSVELHSDQDLPFGHPERATHAQLLAMYLIRTVEDGLEVDEVVNTIPTWAPCRLWCWAQDVFRFRRPT